MHSKKINFRARIWAFMRMRPPNGCHWHVPQAHYLESWSDARAVRRTRVDCAAFWIAPLLHGGKTAHEVINVLS